MGFRAVVNDAGRGETATGSFTGKIREASGAGIRGVAGRCV